MPFRNQQQSSTPYACRTCRSAASFKGERHRMPPACPTITHSAITDDEKPYLDEDRNQLMHVADSTPFNENGELRSRVEELLDYSKKRGYKKLGVAFCVSMLKEAQALSRRIEADGMQCEIVCCRVGAIDYDRIGLTKKHPDKFAAICNPVAQARLLNEKAVDLTVQMGLCIGHDIILQEESAAPVTTIVVKDRLHDHHPIADLRAVAE
ncbi:MAG: DUF1847 domain-containing protein [Leptonema illini]|uniref:DUF1847 domain-containing protein n=1 Tax=Leptonema illini TaxID=183 RepID=A0A833GXU6_9LEPT|nr:MAG: DUF1847 domain-containing protein [Leptonema illini]